MSVSEKKIVVVCGYPKSGTTFSTRLVAQLLSCPSVGFWGFEGDTFVTEGQNRDSDMVCYQSHHPYDLLRQVNASPIYKLIYVVRDPRDIVVSGAFHFSFFRPILLKLLNVIRPKSLQNILKKMVAFSNSKQYKINRMIAMLQNGDPLIDHAHWAWDLHMESYQNVPDALIIKYEDLVLNGPETAKSILEYGGVYKTDEQVKADLEAQSFKKRQRDFKKSNDKIKVRHLRKGIVGDWKNHLGARDVDKIESQFKSQMESLGYL